MDPPEKFLEQVQIAHDALVAANELRPIDNTIIKPLREFLDNPEVNCHGTYPKKNLSWPRKDSRVINSVAFIVFNAGEYMIMSVATSSPMLWAPGLVATYVWGVTCLNIFGEYQ